MNEIGCQMSSESEAKVLYFEGDKLRVFRGCIASEDDHFICLRRRDGMVRIAKSCVVKIQQKGGPTGDEHRSATRDGANQH